MKPILLISAFQLFSVSAFAETFPAANGLVRTLVAEQPLLKNPVSVSVDVDGAIYVTETARRKVADLDIREFVKFGWVPRDVSHTSIDEKQIFFRKQLDGKNVFKGTSLKDQNYDGIIGADDLTAISEKIIRITDKDGDGVYDTSGVFAEGFNTEVTGIAAGTLAWRGDVYATVAPDMWKLRDTDGDGKADKRESLAHGFGVHIAYAGHDMHGLTLGPDGRVYWSIGDKGTNVTSKEGKNYFAPHEGAVLRCYPDGSGFEIFARGLRNPQEIAFDKYGNLFSVDNDSDQKGERERFVHITEGSDTGWRNYYQYRGSAYNPWMAENIWEPFGEHQPAYITPTSANFSDGPSGFAYNPGTALNAKYTDAFFVTEFPKGNLRSFRVKPKGATFEMTDEHTVLSGPMNIGINFGPDGALYSADWAGGYPLNEKGAIWKMDDPKEAGSEIRKEVAKLLKDGPTQASTADLVKQLAHPDMRIRLDAQWELAARKAKDELIATASSESSDQMAVIHSLWGLAQMREFDRDLAAKISESGDAELRVQSLKYMAESAKSLLPAQMFSGSAKLLEDADPRVRFHAAMLLWKAELGKRGGMTDLLLAHLIRMLEENDNKDAYLRHAGVMALTTVDPLVLDTTVSTHKSAAVRLSAAVAFRRLSSPIVSKLLTDTDPKVVAEAAHAIYDDPPITAAYPALADLIAKNPKATVPAARRSIAANRYLADKDSAARLAKYATDESVEPTLRAAALEALASWTEASELNPVDGRYDPLEPADAALARAVSQPVAALASSKEKAIATAAARVAKNLGIFANPEELEKAALDPAADASSRISALDSLRTERPDAFGKMLPALLKDGSPSIRSHAAALIAEKDPAAAIAYAKDAITRSKDIPERQRAVLLLSKIKDPAAKSLLQSIAAATEKDPALLLELSEALPDAGIPVDPALASLTGGDPTLGEKIFNEHLAAQCTACHRIGKEGSDVGPDLTGVGKKGPEYILESLIAPQAKITPGYGMVSLKTKGGVSVSGALKEENAKTITLILPDKTEETVNKAGIESRNGPMSVMPPMGQILTPRELRDLVAWLAGRE